MKIAPTMSKDESIVLCLSGRGDKDVESVGRHLQYPAPAFVTGLSTTDARKH